MVQKTQEQRLKAKQALIDQKAKIEQRLKALESKENAQQRKDDTRRKILFGAFCLNHANTNPDFKKLVVENFKKSLTRPDDQALFSDFFAAPEKIATVAKAVPASNTPIAESKKTPVTPEVAT